MFNVTIVTIFVLVYIQQRYTVMMIYHDINPYDYHTVYICLSTVFGENKRRRISPAPRQQLST